MSAILFCWILSTPVSAHPPMTPAFHPHFPRRVEISLGFDETAKKLSVEHLTATFNGDGFQKTEAGGGWHLANAHLTSEQDLTIGGQKIAAGRHSLRARKKDNGDWELLLDSPGRFRRNATEDARPLVTEWKTDAPVHEHLNIDIQPSGDKTSTKLWLVVHFDRYSARTLIETP